MTKDKEKESSLEKFKKEYDRMKKKHGLPGFDELNQDFQIERVCDVETDYLVREVRKFMAERISNYLRFIEALLHPVNVPMFVFSLVRSFDKKDKETLGDIYKVLAEMEIGLISLDLTYSEDKESEFIRESFKKWQEIKKLGLDLFSTIKSNWGNKLDSNGKGKGYFG